MLITTKYREGIKPRAQAEIRVIRLQNLPIATLTFKLKLTVKVFETISVSIPTMIFAKIFASYVQAGQSCRGKIVTSAIISQASDRPKNTFRLRTPGKLEAVKWEEVVNGCDLSNDREF